jgi:hypothetical protein
MISQIMSHELLDAERVMREDCYEYLSISENWCGALPRLGAIGDLAVNTSTSEQFNACCKNKEERLTRRKFFRESTLVPTNEVCRIKIPLRRDIFYPLKFPIILIFICTLHVHFIIYTLISASTINISLHLYNSATSRQLSFHLPLRHIKQHMPLLLLRLSQFLKLGPNSRIYTFRPLLHQILPILSRYRIIECS